MLTESEVDRLFSEGFDCSQIVLGAVADKLGITKEEAYGTAACFGIGMAQGSVCGAATGALMAIGIKYGNTKPGDFKTKSEVFAKRDEFIEKFIKENGKVICPDMLGQRVDTLEQMILMKDTGIFNNCRRYCVIAISILEEML